jgi:hypothetical protein
MPFNMNANLLHQKALEAVKKYSSAEAELLAALIAIDNERAYRDLGHTSLFNYAVQALKLTESTAYNFITVARKSREVPALMTEIRQGTLSVSKARKVVPVLTRENQAEWISKAQTLPQKSLEKEVARVAPREAAPERATYLSETYLKLTLGISEKLHLKLKRIVDLESQRTRHAAKLEDALEAMAELYLQKNDPLEKAKRAKVATAAAAPAAQEPDPSTQPVARQAGSEGPAPGPAVRNTLPATRIPLPAVVRHAVNTRDQRRCTHRDRAGTRCPETRWLDIHHVRPVSAGGNNEPGNLTTLCFAHHRMNHKRA